MIIEQKYNFNIICEFDVDSKISESEWKILESYLPDDKLPNVWEFIDWYGNEYYLHCVDNKFI